MSTPKVPAEFPSTLGALRESSYVPKSVREELRINLEQRLSEGRPLTSAVLGYEDTVLPQLETALLAGHDIILLGERGQAKSRMIRSLVELLDEWLPIVEGSEVRDDPFAPISAYAISVVSEKGDDTPITWVHRTQRFAEKLASPDTSMADLIGEVDPIKVAAGLFLDDPLALSYGLVPKSNRGIFAMNELPDLSERIQVCLLYTSRQSMAKQVEAMVGFMDGGAEVFDYGNSIRGEAQLGGYGRAFEFPGFVPAYIRPLFCEGKGPFRWAALSGDPKDIARTDQAVLDLFPDNEGLHRWITKARDKVAFEGLPARICWLGYGERDKAGLAFNELVASGEVSAPLVIGRDHLDSGSVASPYRETESMLDGSDAIADWPLLNALVNTASGATWVSIHHGGGVGIGRSIHAGQVCVADGTALAGQKIARVLSNDPGMGIIRHVDAGYDLADDAARERGVRVPMRENET